MVKKMNTISIINTKILKIILLHIILNSQNLLFINSKESINNNEPIDPKKEQKKMDHFYRTVHGQHYLVF